MSDCAAPEFWPSVSEIGAYIGVNANLKHLPRVRHAAIEAIRDFLERSIEQDQHQELYDGSGLASLLPNYWPVTEISSLVIGGRTFGPAAQGTPGYVLDPRALERDIRMIKFAGMVVPRGQVNVSISYTAGYPTCPATVREAFLFICQAIDSAQAVDQNMTSENSSGVWSGGFWATGAGAIPPSARDYLQKFKARF